MNFEKTKPKIFTHGSHQDELNMNSMMASKKTQSKESLNMLPNILSKQLL